MQTTLTFKERLRALKPGQIIWPLVIILVLCGVILGIINYQRNVAATKTPTVKVSTPADNQTVVTPTTEVVGTVEPGSKVMIGEKQVAVDKAGSFSYEVPLKGGQNTVTIVVTGKNGKSTITSRRITYTAPAPVAKAPTNQAVAGKLSNTGPENLWLPEAALISAAAIGYLMTRKELAKAQKRI